MTVAIVLAYVQAQPDLSFGSASDLLFKAGLTGGLIVFAWLMLTDRLYTKGRCEDLVGAYKDRVESLEEQVRVLREDRDDWRAVAKAKVQVVDDAVTLAAEQARRRRGDGH